MPWSMSQRHSEQQRVVTQEGQQHELRRRAQSPDNKQCRQKSSIQAIPIAALPIIV